LRTRRSGRSSYTLRSFGAHQPLSPRGALVTDDTLIFLVICGVSNILRLFRSQQRVWFRNGGSSRRSASYQDNNKKGKYSKMM